MKSTFIVLAVFLFVAEGVRTKDQDEESTAVKDTLDKTYSCSKVASSLRQWHARQKKARGEDAQELSEGDCGTKPSEANGYANGFNYMICSLVDSDKQNTKATGCPAAAL